jgi:uncharacterized sodium:solute symporter family permease YidK
VDLTPWRFARVTSVVIVFGTLAFYIALAR